MAEMSRMSYVVRFKNPRDLKDLERLFIKIHFNRKLWTIV